MKFLLAAYETGAVKAVSCYRGTDTSKEAATQPESIESHCEDTRINCIEQFVLYKDQLVVTRRQGTINIYDKDYAPVKEYAVFEKDDSFVSLFEQEGLCYACTSKGEVAIIDLGTQKIARIRLPTKQNVECFFGDPENADLFAFGGKENDLKVVRLRNDSFEVVFKAKNLKNSNIDLREPVWVKKGLFLQSKKDTYKILMVTGHGQVRIYDSSKSRKPVTNHKISDRPLITLKQLDDNTIICSDTHNTVARFNCVTGVMEGKYIGSVGSITATHILGNFLVTGGLDRYMRCYDVKTRECIAKVYVGTQINDVAIVQLDKKRKEREAEQKLKNAAEGKKPASEAESDSSDEMWSKLEENAVQTRKRRRLELRK